MKSIKKKILALCIALIISAGGLSYYLYNKAFANINISIETTEPPMKSPPETWTIEKATQQKIIKGVFVSSDDKFTLIEIKKPFSLPDNKDNSLEINHEGLKDKSQILVVDNNSKKILWTTPEISDCYSPQWSPDGKEISFVTFDGQKKMYTLWVSSATKHSPRELTSQPWPISGYLWSPNGSHIAVLLSEWTAESNDLTFNFGTWGLYTSLVLVPLNMPSPQDPQKLEFFAPSEYYFIDQHQEPHKVMAWSPDSQYIVFTAKKNDIEELLVVNIDSKQVKTLHRGHHPLYPTYSHDGKWIAFVADVEGNKPSEAKFPIKERKVFLKDLQKEETRSLAATLGKDPRLIGWVADDQCVLVQEGHKTLNKLYKLALQGNKSEVFNTGHTFLSHVSLNYPGTSLGFVEESLTKSPEILISSSKKFVPHSVLPEKTETIALKTEVIQWKSFDGMDIEGILVYPSDYIEGKSYPLIVAAHDGPHKAWEQRFLGGYYESLPFSPAVLATEGYVVLLPNIRGSSNYGLDFARANQEDLGGGDFEDLMAGVDFVIEKGIADPDQLAVWGWGYGGYLAIWATIQTNRFKAAIVGQPIIDFISFAGKMQHSDLLSSYLGGHFWEKKELWLSRSPVLHVEKIKTPIFMQYGSKSPTPIYQGKELKYALTSRKIPVSFIDFELEGHVFDRLSFSRDIGMKSTISWLKKFLISSTQEEAENAENKIEKVAQGEKR